MVKQVEVLSSVDRRRFPTVSGVLFVLSSLPLILVSVDTDSLFKPTLLDVAAVGVAILLALGAIWLSTRLRLRRVAATLGILSLVSLLAVTVPARPSTALAVLLITTLALFSLWKGPGRLMLSPRSSPMLELATRARAGALTIIGLWVVLSMAGVLQDDRAALFWLTMSLAVSFILTGLWLFEFAQRYRWRSAAILLAFLLFLGSLLGGNGELAGDFASALVVPFTACLILPWSDRFRPAGLLQWWEPVLGHPERLLVATFLGLCLIGGILLALPFAAAPGVGVSLVDAAFTAVSAVCVTGLVVLDTAKDFSTGGQVVIIILIQLGGLGIMTFSTIALQLFGGRISLRHEGAVARLVSPGDRRRIFSSARTLLLFTLVVESVGALLLLARFVMHGDSLSRAAWRAGFTSISAFCNAGFALQSNSLIPYNQDPWILNVVGILIILGGLSPAVVFALPRFLRGRVEPIPAQFKIVLVATSLLLVLGFVVILMVEWTNSLSAMSFWDKIHNAWFQSVTLRTAGFNSVDLVGLRPVTLTLMMLLMFIGGSPGGTAGGIKTTTASILLLSVVAAVRGHSTVRAFGRTIPHRTVYRAAAITTVGTAAGLLAFSLMQITQVIPSDVGLFEVVSALGTVGLSLGGTAMLDGIGKGIIITCMYAGRIGPLTLFVFLSQRRHETVWKRPEEEIDVG
ncbi:MAG: potassium transporter TrkH [Acidobacteriota bacterium]|nr:MAG: potassium transporter TrkH [Acidobacteriota bacterium]